MTKQVIGGAGFCTVTVTFGEVPTFPLVSVAWADSVCVPFEAFVLSHWMAYGAVLTGLPSGVPSRKNWTDAMGALPEALAATGTVADTVSLATGLAMPTVGGTVIAEEGMTSTAAIFH